LKGGRHQRQFLYERPREVFQPQGGRVVIRYQARKRGDGRELFTLAGHNGLSKKEQEKGEKKGVTFYSRTRGKKNGPLAETGGRDAAGLNGKEEEKRREDNNVLGGVSFPPSFFPLE